MTAPVPVAYFAYRRADLVARTLAALRENRVPLVYAFSDGARGDEDAEDVEAVRRILRAVDWADVRLIERPVNLGVDVSEPRGISEVLQHHDAVIVCEDDIELSPGSYPYLTAALERYRDDVRVMSISAWTHERLTPPDALDAPHFTGRFPCWGWATWRRAWAGFPGEAPEQLRDLCIARGVDMARYGNDVAMLADDPAAKLTWDYGFSLHMLLHGGLTLLPPRTMAAHIGYDSRATHPQDSTGWEDSPASAPRPEDVRWPPVRENPASAALFRRALDVPPPPTLLARVRRRFARLLKPRASGAPRS